MTRKAWAGTAILMAVSGGCDQRIDPEEVEDAEVEEAVLGAPELVALGAFVLFGLTARTVVADDHWDQAAIGHDHWDDPLPAYDSHRDEPWDPRDQAMDDIWALENAIGEFYMDNGRYPSVLSQVRKYLPNEYLRKDPWGNSYEYDASRSGYQIRSYGADGLKGGTDLDADIVSGDR